MPLALTSLMSWKRLVILFWVAGGIYAVSVILTRGVPEKELSSPSTFSPRWLETFGCAPMNQEEREQAETALHALAAFPRISSMNIGAVRYFARTAYRHGPGTKSQPLCPPEDLYPLVADAMIQQGVFARPYLAPDDLRVARLLGTRDQRIVDAVARTAFYASPVFTEYPEVTQDVRPLARLALAEFGSAAQPWSEQAFGLISGSDPLGTSAAQIAVATGHPEALQRVREELDAIAAHHPTGTFPPFDRYRFIELAYALAFAGDAAKPYIKPVIDMRARREIYLRELCLILRHIDGAEAEAELLRNPRLC